jgi:lysophospholipase L1-like esterase
MEVRPDLLSVRTQFLALLLVLGSFYETTPARAQGDPPRAFDPATAAVRRPGTKIRIALIGDSTQTDHAGYGRGFCANLTAEVDCLNMAKGGASTRTYREMGLWGHSLLTRPDYVLIQFGHNDMERIPFYPPQTTIAQYEANLRRFVMESHAAGIKTILVTPITRQYFDEDGKIHPPLASHAATMKRVAREMNVPLIDLHDESVAYLDRLGPERAYSLGISAKDAAGRTGVDKTHWNWEGSYVFGRMVAVNMAKAVPELARYVRPTPAVLPPEGIKEMKIFRGAPVRIVLTGDSMLSMEIGWGKGFCAVLTPNVTCVDGDWTKALKEHGDYYLIQLASGDQGTMAQEKYSDCLHRMIHEVKAVGAVPVLVTPVGWRNKSRRSLGPVPKLKDDSAAMIEVGAEEYVTVVDLYKFSSTIEDKPMTLAQQQQKLGRMVANALVQTRVELGRDVIGAPKNALP